MSSRNTKNRQLFNFNLLNEDPHDLLAAVDPSVLSVEETEDTKVQPVFRNRRPNTRTLARRSNMTRKSPTV